MFRCALRAFAGSPSERGRAGGFGSRVLSVYGVLQFCSCRRLIDVV